MLLLEKVKILRREFPHIRIRQLNDENNRKYALFILPHCAENMKLFFERDFMVLEFYGSKASLSILSWKSGICLSAVLL